MRFNTVQEQVQLIIADSNGSHIEMSDGGRWRDKEDGTWDFGRYNYRVYMAPEHSFDDDDIDEITVDTKSGDLTIHFDNESKAAEYGEIRLSVVDIEYLLEKTKEK